MKRLRAIMVVLGLVVSLVQGEEAKTEKLFDGKALGGWKVAKFGGEGPVTVTNGCLRLGMGEGCTGVAFTNAFPKVNYEVSLQARRVKTSSLVFYVHVPLWLLCQVHYQVEHPLRCQIHCCYL